MRSLDIFAASILYFSLLCTDVTSTLVSVDHTFCAFIAKVILYYLLLTIYNNNQSINQSNPSIMKFSTNNMSVVVIAMMTMLHADAFMPVPLTTPTLARSSSSDAASQSPTKAFLFRRIAKRVFGTSNSQRGVKARGEGYGAPLENVSEMVGNTPLIKLSDEITGTPGITIYAKAEFANPLSSVKDRLALSIIETAEKEGKLKKGDTVIEATSGNTGIAVAMMCAQRGYKCVITMAEPFSVERRKLMRMLGAQVIVTPKAGKGKCWFLFLYFVILCYCFSSSFIQYYCIMGILSVSQKHTRYI